ncbi:hypothetical protein ACFE04_011991 [Oxalis oulophora]
MALSLLCMKLVLISTGVLSVVFAVKNSVPLVVDFSTTQASSIWSGFCSWLKPPFLYVIINGIIISITASSRFYNTNRHGTTIGTTPVPVRTTPVPVGTTIDLVASLL